MEIFKSIVNFFTKKPSADFNNGYSSGSYRPLFQTSFNGEKNLGEIGPIKKYRMDYEALRLRSWQSYLESEISQTVLNKFSTWVVGKGLKLQAEPETTALASEKIDLDSQTFCDSIEARFSVYKKSKRADYAGMKNLNLIEKSAHLNAIIGGDVLVILRYIAGYLKIQLVDGSHVQSPVYGSEWFPLALANGNRIINGVELSPTGEHVAYYVRTNPITDPFKYERVVCKGSQSELTMAFLVYGLEYRLDNVRGIPVISTVLETLKKLERYKEATVGSAEERQKIVYQVTHQNFSTGESPLSKVMARAFDAESQIGDLPVDVQGNQLADRVAVSTNKQAFNMTPGSELKSLESKNELYFKDFYQVNIDLVCAALGIPPEVAMSKYDSNFSASRAALKDWEHTLNVKRSEFAFQFLQPIYNFWLEIEILTGKIKAPGYLKAKIEGNEFILDAYRNARFVGANVPHIDPVKEVNAERLKLGATAANIPLTTVEAATEALNGGESDANMEQFSKELEKSKKLKIVVEPVQSVLPKKES